MSISSVKFWNESTIAVAQKKLDNIRFTAQRESTTTYADKIQPLIESAQDGKATITETISLSLYIDLLEQYEENGRFCHLKQLSDRLKEHTEFHKLLDDMEQDENVAA